MKHIDERRGEEGGGATLLCFGDLQAHRPILLTFLKVSAVTNRFNAALMCGG